MHVGDRVKLSRRQCDGDTSIVQDRHTSLAIVGLGPGSASLLTVEARDVLASADEVWLRTRRHPTVAGLPDGPRYESFDAVYDGGGSFEEVYETIVGRVLELAARPGGVVYAVPGHPLFGEATVAALLERAPGARIVAGVSFVDAALPALGIDALAGGLLLVDALSLGSHKRLLVPQRPTLIAQVYDRRAASQVKLALLEAYPPEHAVRIVRAAGTTDATVVETTIERLDRVDSFEHLTTLYVPPLALTEDVRSFEGLRAVVARLRDPDGGCPWDLEQTHESLKRFLLEEAYEAVDALDAGEPHRLAEELGDLMMQVVLHAQLGEDEGTFAIEEVIASIATKLIRRHPHVFGDVQVSGPDDVLRNWETLKGEERGDTPILDAVPKAMPALAQAQSIQSRASKAGLAPPAHTPQAITAHLDSVSSGDATLDALGALLFGIVALARERDLDAEEALRLVIRQYREEVAAIERERRHVAPGAER
jgi:tetrapyrrole methylase family protein/MazG family protein